MKNNFKIKAKVWVWGGDMSWYFVNVEQKVSDKIRKKFPKGFVKIKASLGKTSWETSLFPHKKSKVYLLCINKKVRKIESVFDGDEVQIYFTLI